MQLIAKHEPGTLFFRASQTAVGSLVISAFDLPDQRVESVAAIAKKPSQDNTGITLISLILNLLRSIDFEFETAIRHNSVSNLTVGADFFVAGRKLRMKGFRISTCDRCERNPFFQRSLTSPLAAWACASTYASTASRTFFCCFTPRIHIARKFDGMRPHPLPEISSFALRIA